jgi:chaperonin GroES
MKRRLTLAIGCLAFALPAMAADSTHKTLPNLSRDGGSGSLKTHKPQLEHNTHINMAKVNVRPLGDRVLVQALEEAEVKKGGIIIPDTAKEKPQEGKVVALGTGKRDDDGKTIPFVVKAGDKVLISKYGGTEIKVDGESYLIMREDDILGIIG